MLLIPLLWACGGAADPCAGQSGACVTVNLVGFTGVLNAAQVNVGTDATDLPVSVSTSVDTGALPYAVAVPLSAALAQSGSLYITAAAYENTVLVAQGQSTVTVSGMSTQVAVTLTAQTRDLPACSDGFKDFNESDTDCGGPCGPCAGGRQCQVASDCQSQQCQSGLCAAVGCSDGVKDGNETDTDCGGGTCPACGTSLLCLAASDCQSVVCTGDHCLAATCTDGVRNGQESDIDCGGDVCKACALGLGCGGGSDCQSASCVSNKCAAPTCSDGAKNGAETDIDCGGGTCAPCGNNLHCQAASDCQSDICNNLLCATPGCSDGIKNGAETDTDCGGGTCAPCADGKVCKAGSDCTDKICTGGKCAVPTCSDGLQNGNETDTDCGGGTYNGAAACAACADTKACKAGSDCVDKICTASKCAVPTCSDGVKNGAETDTDCGGGSYNGAAACSRCADSKTCSAGSDCVDKICTASKCVVPSCSDGIQNGAETDIDCGGGTYNGAAACSSCLAGKACVQATDCLTDQCTAQKQCAVVGWNVLYSGSSLNSSGQLKNVVIDTAGSVIVSGALGDTGSAGGTNYLGAIDKYTDSGSLLWSKRLSNSAYAVVDTSNNVYIAGYFSAATDFGGGSVSPASGTSAGYLAKYNSAGTYQWAVQFSATTFSKAAAVALDSSGNPVVVGTFSGTSKIGGATLPTASGVWYAKYNAAGTYQWSSSVLGAGTVKGVTVRTNTSEVVYLAQSTQNAGSFGGATVADSNGASYVVLVTLSSAGVFERQLVLGASGAIAGYSAAALTSDSNGDLYVAGSVTASAPGTVGGASSCYLGPFVAKYSGAASAYVWSACTASGGSGGVSYGLALSSSGAVALVGSLSGTMNLGSGAMTTALPSLFIAELSSSGAAQSLRTFPPTAGSTLIGDAVAYDNAGALIVAGTLTGSVNFGLGALTTSASAYGFLLLRASP